MMVMSHMCSKLSQTRLWRDLATEGPKPWLNIWPFENPTHFHTELGWIFEGYPSLVWNQILEIPKRNPSLLIKKIKSPLLSELFNFDTSTRLKSDPDLCDAVVLALGGVLLQEKNKLFSPFPGFWNLECLSTEGWIAGLVLKEPYLCYNKIK